MLIRFIFFRIILRWECWVVCVSNTLPMLVRLLFVELPPMLSLGATHGMMRLLGHLCVGHASHAGKVHICWALTYVDLGCHQCHDEIVGSSVCWTYFSCRSGSYLLGLYLCQAGGATHAVMRLLGHPCIRHASLLNRFMFVGSYLCLARGATHSMMRVLSCPFVG